MASLHGVVSVGCCQGVSVASAAWRSASSACSSSGVGGGAVDVVVGPHAARRGSRGAASRRRPRRRVSRRRSARSITRQAAAWRRGGRQRGRPAPAASRGRTRSSISRPSAQPRAAGTACRGRWCPAPPAGRSARRGSTSWRGVSLHHAAAFGQQPRVAGAGLGRVALADDRADGLEPAGQFAHMGLALVAVAVEQRLGRGALHLAVQHRAQLPGQVGHVAHALAHALAQEGRLHVRRVAGQEHAPGAPALRPPAHGSGSWPGATACRRRA